ncbi:unnamed protein product [Mesocestoides corti]|uniref:39S ribosomal protein L52, mitochondrial n=1 Tax=Mesocestoides corti TaxID=53468 RepID=A0A0R3UEP2_MESCO|nr:unnamed protein product [Mesocestoides corti]
MATCTGIEAHCSLLSTFAYMAYSSSSASHFRAVRARLVRLVGSPAIDINDHAAIKKLQAALEREAQRQADLHEKELAARERQRVRGLINQGILDTKILQETSKRKKEA